MRTLVHPSEISSASSSFASIHCYNGTAYVAAVESNNDRHRYNYFTADCELAERGLLMTIVNENGGRYVMDFDYGENMSQLVVRGLSFDAANAPEHLTATQYTVTVDPALLGSPKEGFEAYIYLTIYRSIKKRLKELFEQLNFVF